MFFKNIWSYGAVLGFFGLAYMLRPELGLEILTATFVSLAALFFVSRLEGPEGETDGWRDELRPATVALPKAYLSFVDVLQFPVFLLDSKANVLHLNRHAVRAFGAFRAGDRITTRFRQPEFRKQLETVIATGKAVSFQYNEPVPNDRWFNVECSGMAAVDLGSRGPDRLFLLAFHDQTEVRRIDQMRSDFIANASHELRTPLASLLGYIETLKGAAKNDEAARERFTTVMLEQAERMSRLVNDLLSLSRIEMKSHVKPSDAVSLRDVLSSVITSVEAVAQQVGVTIELKMTGDLTVAGDRDELIQVFENLVENACKYGEEGKRVIISASRIDTREGARALVSVRDFGPGIAAEHQQRITERFYRVDIARSREKQGTGLGLAIVKHILHRHGTRLRISSKIGEGSEFSVELAMLEGSGVQKSNK